MKARIQFTKTGTMKFLGHLDVMRYFQKLFIRSDLDIAYSKGFNPHPILSFASPLGVGATSEGEYLDLELNSLNDKTPDDLVRRLNKESNGEFRIIKMLLLPDGTKTSMSLLAAADYAIYLKEGYQICDNSKERFAEFLSRDCILITKQTKKSEKKIDLKEYIYDIIESAGSNESVEGAFAIVRLAAGSVMNIKPELLLKAFCEEQGISYNPFAFQIHRLEMYADINAAKGEINSNDKRELRKLVPFSTLA